LSPEHFECSVPKVFHEEPILADFSARFVGKPEVTERQTQILPRWARQNDSAQGGDSLDREVRGRIVADGEVSANVCRSTMPGFWAALCST
jgi:hypothetical protein